MSDESGIIEGTIIDPDGVTLPGVSIILKSPVLIVEKLKTRTNDYGTYGFEKLAPGKYEVTAMLEGSETVVRIGIEVISEQTTVVEPIIMKLQETESENEDKK